MALSWLRTHPKLALTKRPLSLDRVACRFIDASGTTRARFSRGFTVQLAFGGASTVRSRLRRSLGRSSPEINGAKIGIALSQIFRRKKLCIRLLPAGAQR
jgi:hypothetical protein